MTVPEEDALLVATDASELNSALSGIRNVIQSLPPRLGLVRLPVPQLPDGVQAFTDQPPDSVLQQLSEVERLFVEAWLARRERKDRIGNGESWDARGFAPPD